MKILFDHNMPTKLKRYLTGHVCFTAGAMNWGELENGELLAAAQRNDFSLMITADQSIQYQQNNEQRQIAMIVLSTNDWKRIKASTELILAAIARCEAKSFEELPIPPDTRMRRR